MATSQRRCDRSPRWSGRETRVLPARQIRDAPMADAANPTANGHGLSAVGDGAAVAADRIEPRRLIAFLAMVFGMFMAILDVQIVSASITEIQAGLAASSNEISWVQTAYLIAEVVMIPLS